MQYILGIIALLLAGLYFMFAGNRVEVPPGHVAKIFGKSGYQEGIKTTSKFRLDPCLAYCDEIVYMPINEFSVSENMELFMPADKLVMKFTIKAVIYPRSTEYDTFFQKVTPNGNMIQPTVAYENMAKMLIQTQARELLSKYTIAEIVSSLTTINQNLSQSLTTEIETRSPFAVKSLGMTELTYPPIIVKAQENAAERREAIQSEEASLEVSKVRLERELQEQQMQRTIDVAKAEAEAEVNRILASSITPAYVKYRQLGALDKISDSENTKFVPVEMLSSMSGQMLLAQPTGKQ